MKKLIKKEEEEEEGGEGEGKGEEEGEEREDEEESAVLYWLYISKNLFIAFIVTVKCGR